MQSTFEELKSFNLGDTQNYQHNLEALANLYVKGYEIDWILLHQGESHQKVSLPTYPFLKERYWIPEEHTKAPNRSFLSLKESANKLHPFVGWNASTLTEQSYKTLFTGDEFYLEDHVILDQKILPGVVYLEMARAAGELAIEHHQVIGLRQVAWLRPIVVDRDTTIRLSLHRDEAGDIQFKVLSSHSSAESVVHAQGKLIGVESDRVTPELQQLDILEIEKRCPYKQSKEEIYKRFKEQGIEYGPTFQTIEWVISNEKEALARIQLPSKLEQESKSFLLHPSILDGALQSAVGLLNQDDQLRLPFAVEEVDILHPLDNKKIHYAYAQAAGHDRFHVAVLDENGLVCVTLKDVVVRATHQAIQKCNDSYYRPHWVRAPFHLMPILFFKTIKRQILFLSFILSPVRS